MTSSDGASSPPTYSVKQGPLTFLSTLQDVIDTDEVKLRSEIGNLNQAVVTEYLFYLRGQLSGQKRLVIELNTRVDQMKNERLSHENLVITKLDRIAGNLGPCQASASGCVSCKVDNLGTAFNEAKAEYKSLLKEMKGQG